MAWDSTVDSKMSGAPLPPDKGQFGQNNASEEHKPLADPPGGAQSGGAQPSSEQPAAGEPQVNQGPAHQEYGGERS